MHAAVAWTLLGFAVAAPVPPEPLPDPLGWGFLGIRVEAGTLRIAGVEPGTPAEKAGLRPDDEFVRVGDLTPLSFDEVAEHISGFRPGSSMKVVVNRNGESQSVVVRLGVRPAELPPPPTRTRVIPVLPEP
ncbi:MAG: PDZ domain-containing protein [Fimbriiglobus sp.]